MSALDKQVAGSHYKTQKVQPLELGYLLGQTPCFVKVAKYATRIKDDKVEQLEKAKHCIEIEKELRYHLSKYNKASILLADELICEFTEDKLLRNVLLNMHGESFDNALKWIDKLIERKSA